MSRIERLLSEISQEKIKEVVKNSHCMARVIQTLELPMNGTSQRVVTQLISMYAISTSHFDIGLLKRKHPKFTKICPVCKTEFKTQEGRDEKTVCSKGCSNTFFRSGKNNPNYNAEKENQYREICFEHHKKECVVCSENLIVAVHHFNEIHEDDRPENLVPLCPTHHQYWHSKHRHLIQEKVEKYVSNFTSTIGR